MQVKISTCRQPLNGRARPAMNDKASRRDFLSHASRGDLRGGIGLEDDAVLDSAGR